MNDHVIVHVINHVTRSPNPFHQMALHLNLKSDEVVRAASRVSSKAVFNVYSSPPRFELGDLTVYQSDCSGCAGLNVRVSTCPRALVLLHRNEAQMRTAFTIQKKGTRGLRFRHLAWLHGAIAVMIFS